MGQSRIQVLSELKIVEFGCRYLHLSNRKMSSEHDRAVLNCIFNPLLPAGGYECDEDLHPDVQGWL